MKKYFCVWIVVFALFIGCKEKVVEKDVIARVGKATLTESQFYSYIPSEYMTFLTPVQKKELVEMWVSTELLYQEALKEKLNSDKDIKARLHEMERQIVANAFLENQMTKVGSVDEVTVRTYFENNKEKYNTERKFAQILVNTEVEAKKIAESIDGGENFSAIARTHSIDPSVKHDSGVKGYLRIGDFQFQELEEIVFSLKKIGDVSEPTATKYGYFIIKLLDIKELRDAVRYEDVRERIREKLDFSSQKSALDSLITQLKENYKVETHYELLGGQ